MRITTSEARARWKEVIDAVLSGEDVEIVRGGVTFNLVIKGQSVPPALKAAVLEGQTDIEDAIKNNSVGTANGWMPGESDWEEVGYSRPAKPEGEHVDTRPDWGA